VDAIGDQLAIARVTVELHLRTARQKLGAKTTPEAVARALLYRQIHPT
jgi:DNA-binding CsgD family transcriptional regulator